MISMKPLVIIPTYNEAGSIRSIIENILDIPQHFIHILVVDDGSPDGTAEIVEGFKRSRVHLIKREGKSGLGSAYRAGLKWALEHTEYTHIVTMDGDSSHRTSDLNRMLARSSVYDLVIGSRWIPGGEVINWPLSRRALSRAGSAYSRIALGLPFRDVTGGYRVYSRKLIEKMEIEKISSEGYCFQIEMLFRAYRTKMKITESPITFVERREGESKMSKAIVFEAVKKVSRWGIRYRLGLIKD